MTTPLARLEEAEKQVEIAAEQIDGGEELAEDAIHQIRQLQQLAVPDSTDS